MATYIVTIRSTSITVYPGSNAAYPLEPLIDLLTYDDEYVDEVKTLGYIYSEQEDLLYFHKGVDPKYIQRLLNGDVEFKYDNYHPYREMKFEYEEIVPPRNDEQIDVINFIAGLNQFQSSLNRRQLFLVKKTGFG